MWTNKEMGCKADGEAQYRSNQTHRRRAQRNEA